MSTTTTITHPDGTSISTTTTSAGAAPSAAGTIKKYYTATGLPNPVIVDVAAAELGVDLGPVDTQVDVLGGANRSPEMLEKNPSGGVPMIELNDGTCISETVAIAAYLEDAESTNGVSLFGATPKDKAVIRARSRSVEQQIAIPIMNWFRWGPAKDLFKERGAHAGLGNDSAAAQQLETVKGQLKWLNDLMVKSKNTYICGNDITICDCILFGQLFFFADSPAFGAPLKEHTFDNADLAIPWVKTWYEAMKARPTVAKLVAKYLGVPKEVVHAGMQAIEDAYNKGDYAFCGACYTDQCNVVVNGGGPGYGPFTTPAQVTEFFKTLREVNKATDMKFTITEVGGGGHKDTWTSASMTGSCDAKWVQDSSSPLGWKISEDMITGAPK